MNMTQSRYTRKEWEQLKESLNDVFGKMKSTSRPLGSVCMIMSKDKLKEYEDTLQTKDKH